ncbi:DUF4184 family protein [Nocardia macrotermitis]|uniref:DUF4184 family protein n=1 Tax=Nocardia macrotermitis TaxID=2585198 RepID=A0A7K0DD98_9NOCA|nr:DUF4184 family protein [Nocardia macrotermitis]MQY23687.1 hypothetical protein [Nocardia macrotermitis]
MPLTFPSHSLAVLPLKLRWPRRWDGVALVVGSAVPDASYPVAGFFSMPETHALPALLWWCLPVGIVGTALIRWGAPAIAAHLPRLGGFDLPAYGVLGAVRYRWYVTVYSLLGGAITHIFWDGFTHDPAGGHGWAVARFPVLLHPGLFGRPWWYLLQQTSTVGGAVLAIGVFYYIGRRGLIRRWHGEPAAVARMPRRFWLTASLVAVVGLLLIALMPLAFQPFVLGVRLLYVAAIALLAGAAVTRSGRSSHAGVASVR